jgi:peptidoglycan/LPS O-acetylase OafA/YrhL
MFFYLIFGLAMLTAKARYVVMAVVFITLAALGLFIHSDNALIRFYTSPLLLEFMFGILLYRGRDYYAGMISNSIATVVLIVGFIVLAIPNVIPNQLFGIAIGRVVADGIPAAFIVGSAIIVFENTRLTFLKLLGDASYSIYITHLFAVKFAVHCADLLNLSDPSPLNMVLVISMQMIMATILGVIVHKVIEKPVTSFLQARIKARQVSALALS